MWDAGSPPKAGGHLVQRAIMLWGFNRYLNAPQVSVVLAFEVHLLQTSHKRQWNDMKSLRPQEFFLRSDMKRSEAQSNDHAANPNAVYCTGATIQRSYRSDDTTFINSLLRHGRNLPKNATVASDTLNQHHEE